MPSDKDHTSEQGEQKGGRRRTAASPERRPGSTDDAREKPAKEEPVKGEPIQDELILRLREELVSVARQIIAVLGDDDLEPAIGRPTFDPMGPRARSRPMMGRGRGLPPGPPARRWAPPLAGFRGPRGPGGRPRPGPPGARRRSDDEEH
jgi:hypothetical protein